MALKKGSTSTRVSSNQAENNQAETNNMITAQMEQLMKIIQGYEENNNATTGMMAEMKNMFDEKLQNLEKKKQHAEIESQQERQIREYLK